ncbi:MAG TPA: DNA topoisomerase IB [Solirubrobacteraceae bacterium]|nr:DNA topoisomerase IB [Solirubrobacteraceae bacterium]
MPRLRRADCSEVGFARRRRGRGFEYLDAAGQRLVDADTLARIRELAIPPAWTDVWICPDPLGHLQATGVDAAGRKQYLYHPSWRARRDRAKFDAMLEFAAALPRLRRRARRELRGEELTHDRVLACALLLLDLGFFRIGSESYAEQNGSFGLVTMVKRHVRVESDELVFDYQAKGGRRRVQAIADPSVREVVAELKRRRGGGERLLAYRDDRHWVELRSEDLNARIKALTGGEFSAKDFRTWNATVLAAVAVAGLGSDAASKAARKRAVNAAVKAVSAYLGNTPAVCRASYIDPRVFDRFRGGHTIAESLDRPLESVDLGQSRAREEVEAAVLDLIGN